MSKIAAILFDFDGTLIDSSEDLAHALNAVRRERSEAPVPLARLRPHTARGARSMIAEAYGFAPEHPEFASIRERFLAHYEVGLLRTTQLWPGMDAVIDVLAARKIAWGIVTNKASRFAQPIVRGLRLQPHVLVCGDTTARMKPYPDPLLHAAAALTLPARTIAYVGDAISDMQAARAANMVAVGAGYSHFVDGHDRSQWAADVWVDSPTAILDLI